MYEYFEKALKLRGLRAIDVSRGTGIPPSTFSDWKAGRSTPKTDKMKKIADFLNVSVDFLLTGKQSDIEVANEVNELLKSIGERPLYEVAAGNGRINSAPEYVSSDLPDDCELIQIVGDSMLPELRNGDICVVEKTTQITPKDYTVIKVDGESATVKHVEITDNGIYLRADNKEVFADTFYTIQDVMTLPITIIGKVIEIRRAI